MSNFNHLSINLSAIQKNLYNLAQKLPSTRIMPMVKAEGYGTNALMLTSFIEKFCNVTIVGVSHLKEAIALRENGVTLPIFVIATPISTVKRVVEYDVEIGVSDKEFCLALNEEAKKQRKKIKVHLHANTGMQRFGCPLDEVKDLASQILHSSHLQLEGLMTHFSSADDPKLDEVTTQQIHIFENVVHLLHSEQIYPKWIHAANSSGAIRFNLPFCNLARIGLATYGVYSHEKERQHILLHPALSLQSSIVGVNHCRCGDHVGYLNSYKVEKESARIAILGIGYHDGLHLSQSNRGYVLIHGKKAPKVGRICMDYMMVDITEIPEAKMGDPALIFGQDLNGNYLPIESVASWSDTNVREVMCCLGTRVERMFKIDHHTFSHFKRESSTPLIRNSFKTNTTLTETAVVSPEAMKSE